MIISNIYQLVWVRPLIIAAVSQKYRTELYKIKRK